MLLSSGMVGTSKPLLDNTTVDHLHNELPQAQCLLEELDAVVCGARDGCRGVVLELGVASWVPAKHSHRRGDAAVLKDEVLGHCRFIPNVGWLHNQTLDVTLGPQLEHCQLRQAYVALCKAGSCMSAFGV